MNNKIIKWKKLIICVTFILGAVLFFAANMKLGAHTDTSSVINTYSGLSYIKHTNVIDKNMVIKSLSNVQQLVGMEGHVFKSYTYTDSIFQENGWMKDLFGLRTVNMDVNAYFKMGINLSDIKAEDISVYSNTLFVRIPKQVLISLDVPYDQIIFKTKAGLIRTDMTEHEKQLMYTEVRKLLTNEIMNDGTIINKSVSGVQSALQSLLEKVPNCNRVVFQGK